ncbi:hypothetical protein V2J09_006294 [Rumex salicifolius]
MSLCENLIIPGSKIPKDVDGVKVNCSHYKLLVRIIMYLTTTRPDAVFVVGMISRYMSCPTELRFMETKRILRCLQGTINYEILYQKEGNKEIEGFTEYKKSMLGYVFLLSNDVVTWSSKKEHIVILSIIEAVFVAATTYSIQMIWI